MGGKLIYLAAGGTGGHVFPAVAVAERLAKDGWQVAEELNLADLAEFDEAQDLSSLKSGLIALGLMSDPSLVAVEKRVLDNVRKRLSV